MIDIITINGETRFSTPINEGCKRIYKLMSKDYITLKFSTAQKINFIIGDYTDIDGFGRFVITENQFPVYNKETAGFDYELIFEAQYRKWKNKIMKFITQFGAAECSWDLTATVLVHMEQVLNNLRSLASASTTYLYNGETEWTVSVDSTVDMAQAKHIAYDNIYILDGISAIAEAFECEWWVAGNVIYLGKCEFGEAIDLELGTNIEYISDSDNGNRYATRIFAFGSKRNLPANYRKTLLFSVTGTENSGNIVYDASRPLKTEWFDEGLIVSKDAFNPMKTVIGSGSFSDTINKETGTHQVGNAIIKNIADLSQGSYKLNLTGYKPSVTVYRIGTSHEYGWIESVDIKVTVSGKYNDSDGSAKTFEHTESIGQYIYTRDSSINMQGFDYDMNIPYDLTACTVTVKMYAHFSTGGICKLAIYPYGTIVITSPAQVYGLEGLILEISGDNAEIIDGVKYNPDFAEGDDANRFELPGGKTLPIGTQFKIANIKNYLVDSSYFSSVSYNENAGDNVVVNDIIGKRLMLPAGTPYVAVSETQSEEEAVEDVVIFENVYPRREEEISEDPVPVTENETIITENGETVIERTTYQIKLSGFNEEHPFDNKYKVPDTELQLSFSSGILNGCTFELTYLKDNTFQIVRDTKQNIPNTVLKPAKGDKCTLVNFDVSLLLETAVDAAESELLEKTREYVEQLAEDTKTYSCTIMSDAMAGYRDGAVYGSEALLPQLYLGRKVTLISPTFLKGKRESRVIGYELNLDIPYNNAVIIIGEKSAYSRIGDIKEKLDEFSHSFAIGGNGISTSATISRTGTYLIKQGDSTPPSDTNTFSALRAISEFISRNTFQTLHYLWNFAKGIRLGNFKTGISGAQIDESGNAELNKLNVRNGAEITGQATINGKIEVTSDALIEGDASIGGDTNIGGNADIKGTATAKKVTTERVTADRETDGAIVSSGNFDGTSALTGTGYGIMKEGNDYRMAIDYLTVRKGMTVAELVIQEYKSVGGVLVVSACNGEIERVYKWDSGAGYDVYIKDFDKNPQFMAGDYVRCARWDSETGAYAGYWVKVTNIVTNSAGEKCLNLMSSGFPAGTEPQAGDKLVQFGNATDTTRQGLILISVEDGKPNITAYDGIDSADVDLTEKMCARLGNLNGIVKGGKDLQGYGLWTNNLYLHSETTQALTEIVAGLNAGIAEAGQKAEAVGAELAAYKTEVTKEFEATDEKFTSAYKAATTAVGNLLLGTNQGARNWLFATDSANKPLIQDSSDEGVNGVMVDYVNTNTATGYEVFLYPLRPEKIVAGATYTLSVEVREHASEMSTALIFDTATSTGKDSLCKAQTSTQTTQSEAWVKFTFTFKATATGVSGGGQYIRLYLPAGSVGKMSVMELRNLMLAPGGEAMPWTKAPEDITAENLDAEVAVLETRASTIEQTVKGISQTVTQHTETLTAQGNRITKNETAIKQNADSITQTVTKIEGGMNNLLEGTNLGAEGWTAWCNGGGIVIGDEPIDGYDRYKAAVMTNANKDMTGTVFWSWHLRGDLIKKGKPYTLSFDVWQADTDEDEAFRFGARVSLGSGANADSLLSEVRTQSTVKGAWTHVCVTFAESQQDGTDPINGTENPEYCLYLNYIKKWTALKIKNLKFEEGAIGTPWTPAIKDADVQYTEIRQTAEGISMKLHESATAQNYAYGTGTAKIMTSGWNASGDTNFWLYDVKGFKTGDVVTVSFDIEISGISRGASTDYISMQFNKYYGYKATGFRFTLDKIDDTQTADFLTKLSYSGTLTLGQTTAEGDLAQRDITAEDVATLYLFIRKAEPFGENSYIKISRLKVERGDTATAWTPRTGTIDQRLLDTGIDIESRKVTVTADNFVVRNNAGETTAMIDGNGKLATKIINADELITKRLIAVNEAGQVVSTINIVSQDGRYYTHYPVDSGDSSTIYAQEEGYNIGFPVSAMGYDAATDSVLTVNNRKGKARWRLAVGTDGGKYGVVTEFDKWNTVGMAQKSAAIDEDSIQSVIDGLIFPASVEFQEISGGEFTATPLYGTLDMPTMLQVSYKEFDPGQDSAYDTHKGHVKVWDLYESSLEDDFDFTTGVTGVFLRTTRPVQGVVRNNTATDVVSVTFTWTLYIYENGVLATTRTQAMTYIQ